MPIRQVRIKLNTNWEGSHYAGQHKRSGRDVCRECKTGQCNHSLMECSCVDRLMGHSRLCKGPGKERNYVGVSEEVVETKTVLMRTANAYKKGNWDNHY